MQKKTKCPLSRWFPFCWRDLVITTIILFFAAGLCILLQQVASDGFASPVFVLAVVLILPPYHRLPLRPYRRGSRCSLCQFHLYIPVLGGGFHTGWLSPYLLYIFNSIHHHQCPDHPGPPAGAAAGETEKEKMRANLLRSVSHDIRTPLTSIVGSTSAVLENPGLSEQERRELLEDVRDEAQWLIRVVENLLSITRMGEDQARITKDPEAVEEVLGEAVRKFRRRFPNVEVTVSVPQELLLVPMDPILIEQVLANLLENAVFHGKTSHIHITVSREKHDALFSVWNDGNSIPEKDLPTLFDGTMKHSESTNCDGKRSMGLGLSVCLAIVRAHGGTMDAQNLEVGTEFTFRLPMETKEVPV